MTLHGDCRRRGDAHRARGNDRLSRQGLASAVAARGDARGAPRIQGERPPHLRERDLVPGGLRARAAGPARAGAARDARPHRLVEHRRREDGEGQRVARRLRGRQRHRQADPRPPSGVLGHARGGDRRVGGVGCDARDDAGAESRLPRRGDPHFRQKLLQSITLSTVVTLLLLLAAAAVKLGPIAAHGVFGNGALVSALAFVASWGVASRSFPRGHARRAVRAGHAQAGAMGDLRRGGRDPWLDADVSRVRRYVSTWPTTARSSTTSPW